jgi:anaerobic selenocysteine-containing dehydrogenase
MRRVQGYCALCWSKCGCISVVENNRLVAVEPDQQHPTGQALCGKGRAAPELVNHEDRLLYPLKRTRPKGGTDPGWERIGWNEALDTVSSKLKEISHDSGTDSVAFGIATAAGTSISDGYRWIERLRRAFGSPNAAIAMELCGYAKEMAFPHTFGVEMPVVDLEHTDCIMLWGHNPTVTWLAYGSRIAQAKDNGAKLIVVDPRHVGLASKADQWLRIQPGTDGALALGLANIIIENEWYDGEFIRNWTNGPHLIRMDTGNFLTSADLDEGNDSDHLVAWNQTTGTVILYDRLSGTYSTDFTQLALFGHFEVSGANGPISCRPAFSQYAELCNRYTPERVEQLTSIPAQQIFDTAQLFGNAQAPSFYAWSGLEMHTNVSQTNRAIALLYALTGNFDSEGGNVIFETTPLNDVFGDDLIST